MVGGVVRIKDEETEGDELRVVNDGSVDDMGKDVFGGGTMKGSTPNPAKKRDMSNSGWMVWWDTGVKSSLESESICVGEDGRGMSGSSDWKARFVHSSS